MDTTGGQLIELKENAGNAPISLNPTQQFLAPYANILVAFWFWLWVATAVVLLVKLWHEYRHQNKDK